MDRSSTQLELCVKLYVCWGGVRLLHGGVEPVPENWSGRYGRACRAGMGAPAGPVVAKAGSAHVDLIKSGLCITLYKRGVVGQ